MRVEQGNWRENTNSLRRFPAVMRDPTNLCRAVEVPYEVPGRVVSPKQMALLVNIFVILFGTASRWGELNSYHLNKSFFTRSFFLI